MTPRHLPERFLVAFSFAGEQRDLVRAVAELVERELGSDTVFLDEWFEYYIAGADADLKLQHIYGERCGLVVVCVSKYYGGKPWTQAEHEAVRARLMKARSLTEERERDRILPIRVGDGDVDGIMFNTIVPDIRKMTVAQAAELIIKRLRHVIPDLQSASTDLHLDQERQKENKKRLQKLKKETMGRVNPITILHLSDMQFGKNHRFGVAVTPEGDNPYDTLRERLILDLRKLRKDHGLVPDLMILTGDLTEWGKKPEFDGVLELILGLEKELSLARERLIVIPGNHDINRNACAAYFNECEADDIQPTKPYWAKWRHYVRFFGE